MLDFESDIITRDDYDVIIINHTLNNNACVDRILFLKSLLPLMKDSGMLIIRSVFVHNNEMDAICTELNLHIVKEYGYPEADFKQLLSNLQSAEKITYYKLKEFHNEKMLSLIFSVLVSDKCLERIFLLKKGVGTNE